MAPAVTFVTLFLGLILGPRPVTVAVEGSVAQVEIRLDGETLGTLDGEPWTLTCDFGLELAPHELVAIGRDREGREVARARQLVNLPRRQAEARLALQGVESGPPRSARLAWETMEGLRPVSIRLAFDDRPLKFDDPADIPLPSYDPGTVHSLTAELTFTGDLEARATASFGGGLGERVETGLTAVPILAAGPRVKTPRAERMADWFKKGGRPLEVFAAEKTSAEILIVVDHRAQQRLWDLGRQRRQGTYSGSDARFGPRQSQNARRRDRLRLVAATPEPVDSSGAPRYLFQVSEDLNRRQAKHKGIRENLFRRGMAQKPGGQRLADAVATAGLLAAEGNRARAVVLIVDDHPRDLSQLPPGTVRRYLSKLRVPFRVWSTSERSAATAWGEATPIIENRQLAEAIEELRQLLDRQHMVWLVGSHLPQEIEIHREGWEIAG